MTRFSTCGARTRRALRLAFVGVTSLLGSGAGLSCGRPATNTAAGDLASSSRSASSSVQVEATAGPPAKPQVSSQCAVAAAKDAHELALHWVRNDSAECLDEVLEGVQLDDRVEGSLLVEAVRMGSVPMTNALLAAGASADSVDASSMSALHVAATDGSPELAELLIRNGSRVDAHWDVRSRSPEGEEYRLHATPLHLAAAENRPRVVELLLRHGADVDAVFETLHRQKEERPGRVEYTTVESAWTALDLAVLHVDTAALLRNFGAHHGPTFRRSMDLVAGGERRTQSGRLNQAAALFERAAELAYSERDGVDNRIAQLKLARAYARLATPTATGECDANQAYRAVAQLRYLLRVDNRTAREELKNPAYDGIRQLDFFIQLAVSDFSEVANAAAFVAGKTFRTACPGSGYCPVRALTLHRDGRWDETTHANSAAYMASLEKGEPIELELARRSGTWTVGGNEVQLKSTKTAVERLPIAAWGGSVGELVWPDPNDESGGPEAFVREGCVPSLTCECDLAWWKGDE